VLRCSLWLLKKNAFATYSISYASGQSVDDTQVFPRSESLRVRVRGDVLRETGTANEMTAAGRAGLGLCTIASMQACRKG
jgi:hypothetical protein